jgi:hypothetical protein
MHAPRLPCPALLLRCIGLVCAGVAGTVWWGWRACTTELMHCTPRPDAAWSSVVCHTQCAADKMKVDKLTITDVGPAFLVTSAVIGYSAVFLDQMRMMIFLTLQSLVVPVYKHRFCRVVIQETKDGVQELPVTAGAEMLPVRRWVAGLGGRALRNMRRVSGVHGRGAVRVIGQVFSLEALPPPRLAHPAPCTPAACRRYM